MKKWLIIVLPYTSEEFQDKPDIPDEIIHKIQKAYGMTDADEFIIVPYTSLPGLFAKISIDTQVCVYVMPGTYQEYLDDFMNDK
ncbi:MAG: hypothetical protein WC477_06125 [Patescibacteria group bacterium]